jgi:signal transduction histidine kinase
MRACASPGRGVEISVRDTGRGIAPAHLERIFGEYERSVAPDATQEEGWGLGLVICRRMATLLGGEIVAQSELGKGSVFTVRLPASRLA